MLQKSVGCLLLLCCPAVSLGFTILGEIFAYMTVFFNPAIVVVTFRLRGWCMLCVFLFLAVTCQGHECQDLLSPCDGMRVCTDYTLIQKSFLGGMESEPMLNPKQKSPLSEKILPRGGSNPRCCIMQDS